MKKIITMSLLMLSSTGIANSPIGGQVFGQDHNALHLFWKNGEKKLPLADKSKLAESLVQEIVEHYRNK